MQREKHTISGKLFEADFYPVFSDGRRMPRRAPKEKTSSEAQARYNALQAQKHLVRTVNVNFDNTDYFSHPTYSAEFAPQTEEEARRDINNYLRRVKYNREAELKKHEKHLSEFGEYPGLIQKIEKLREPFRYVYIIEQQVYKRGPLKGYCNWHFHLFMTGGLDAAQCEELWYAGVRVNVNTFKPEVFGPEAAANYCAKDPCGKKRFVCSKNIKKLPKPKVKDGKVSAATVKRMATLRVDDKEFWENKYKGYKFLRCYARKNEYNGFWYLSVVMYRSDEPVPWHADEWLTEDLCC